MNKRQALNILGLEESASEDDIKKAYRKLAMKHHPDRGGDEAKFKQVKEAFEFLENPPQQQNQFRGAPPGFEDFFAKFGGGAANFDFARTFNVKPQRRYEISITAEEAFNGCSKKLGHPFNAQVEIPPGVSKDQCVFEAEIQGSECFFFPNITSKYQFDWGEYDLSTRGDLKQEYFVSPFKMIVGGWEEVHTLDGSVVSVRIPAGLSANTHLKIKEKGYWKNTNRHARGDLFLKVVPDIKKIDEYSKDELSNFAKSIIG